MTSIDRRTFVKTATAAGVGLTIARGGVMGARSQEETKELSIVVDEAEAEYTIDVGGTIDPENLEIIIENLGDTPVVNPRMTVNGLYDWYDVTSLVAEITRDAKTDEEKAMAMWSWVLHTRFQRAPDDRSALHPVRAMNGYGYGICGHTSAWMKRLWTAAGLQARVHEIWGHTVSEAFYDGAWHMLDGNGRVFYLDRDNRTIADVATLERDKWLIERTIHAQDAWVRGPDRPGRNEQFVRYFISHKDNYEEHSYDSEIAKDYTMAMTLKPGERLVRWWGPELGKFEGSRRRPEAPERYANGQLIWEPDTRRIDMRPYVSVPDYGNIATRPEDGRDPAIHVADLQDALHTRPSVFEVPIKSPYPIVGGRFSATLLKEGESGLASVFFGRPRWEAGDLYNFRRGNGTAHVDLSLDPGLLQEQPAYEYAIGFALRGDAQSSPPTQAGLEGFRSTTDLQVSPHSLPALSLGKNVVRYRDQSPGSKQGAKRVRITHRWREISGRHLPAGVATALEPPNGAVVKTLTPQLRWASTTDPDPGDTVVDYQVMVSLRPDCRWPLSPTLYQSVGSRETTWKVPASFLNPGTTYYWRVRARDSRGDIGEWSPVFHFETSDHTE
ncbi:MAG: hypothetical protein GEU99_20850 [Luteitalea sp.]|nr:hypothetical protein [Luteitalea sp.]